MDRSSLVAQLWAQIEALTPDDMTFCIRNSNSLLEPGSKLTSVLADPGSYNANVILALILLRRYAISHSPHDIGRASKLMLKSMSLIQEPGYAFFIFTLASRSLDLFEEGMELGDLDRAIDLLDQFISVQKHGSSTYLMATIQLSCACLKYYLQIDNEQPLQSAVDTLEEGRQNSPQCQWISSFGEFRSLLIVGDVLRHRYEVFGQQRSVDLEGTASGVLSILDLFPIYESNHCTTYEALVVSIILGLAQTIDCDNWSDVLGALQQIVTISLPMKPLVDPLSNLSHLPSESTLLILSQFINQCPTTPTNRAVCLIYMADILEHSGTSSLQILDADDETARLLWGKQWMLACKHLQSAIHSLQTKIPLQSVTLDLKHFRFQTKVNDQPTRFNVRIHFRELNPVDTHICMFDFVPVPVTGLSDLEENFSETGNSGEHAAFLRGLRTVSKYISQDELEHFIENPDDLDSLLNRPRFDFSRFPTDLVARWKQSPGVIAILIMQRSRLGQKDMHRAGSLMLKVKLDQEPAYEHWISRIANELRHYEKDATDIGHTGQLVKEFLRVQTLGSPRHFFAVMELASISMINFFHGEGGLPLVAAALELFREGVGLRGSGPWMFEAGKLVVLGRILHNRHAMYFGQSDEALEETSRLIMNIWDLLPSGRPFRASVIQMIVITILLYLSKEVETSKWHEVLRLLEMGLDLYLYGEMPRGDDFDSDSLVAASQVLYDSGFAGFSLPSEAMCLVHISDIMRSIVLDTTRQPGCLALSVDMYERNLRAHFDWKHEVHKQYNRAMSRYWTKEKEGLYQAILVCTQRPGYPSTFERFPLSIFRYRACTFAAEVPAESMSHSCILQYYLTWTSHLPEPSSPSPSLSVPSSPSPDISEPYMDAWPGDFMSPALMSRQDASRNLPSTIIPGFEKIAVDEGHELFKMPLEQRTIRALIRNVEYQVRSLEKQSSRNSEALIRMSTSDVYWNPRDVQLNTRVQSLKKRTPYLARIAPLQALLSQGPEKCLEMVESSRALFWTRLLRLRTPFTGLPNDLADELEVVAQELDNCKSQSVAMVSKEELQKQFELESIFSSLLAKARKVPGFENLLVPKTYDMLMEASCRGPVVILVGSDSTYAALVVRVTGVDSVFLPALTDAALEKMIVGLNQATKASRGIIQSEGYAKEPNESMDRYGKPRTAALTPVYENLLGGMWKVVVKPIFEQLGYLSAANPPTNRPRLWWCPTGRFAFLPIHAAGSDFGKSTMEGVSKYVVSSYTPTLSALISTRSPEFNYTHALVSDLRILVLAQPTTKGLNNLPMTIRELELIENLIPSTQLLRIAEGPLACSNANKTVDEATTYLTDASILHLACHGHQDRTDPLNSGFELEDGRLTVSKLISCHTPNAFLAFLSACESASNDLEIPDESLNLSAAMLYAGFRSVIGTMWSMNDNDGPEISRLVYQELFKDAEGRVLDPDLIPAALDSAVSKLQKQGVHPGRWATYIHVGV